MPEGPQESTGTCTTQVLYGPQDLPTLWSHFPNIAIASFAVNIPQRDIVGHDLGLCAHVYVHVHTYIYIYIYVYRYVCMYVCKFVYIYIYTCMYMCVYIYVYMCGYTCEYVYVFMYIYIYVYIFMYIYICIYVVPAVFPSHWAVVLGPRMGAPFGLGPGWDLGASALPAVLGSRGVSMRRVSFGRGASRAMLLCWMGGPENGDPMVFCRKVAWNLLSDQHSASIRCTQLPSRFLAHLAVVLQVVSLEELHGLGSQMASDIPMPGARI